MTTAGKIIAITILWFVFGLLVWIIASSCNPRTVVWVLGVIASGTYFALLTVLFFVKGRG